MFVFGFKSGMIKLFPKLHLPKYDREVIHLDDGQTVALDWLFAATGTSAATAATVTDASNSSNSSAGGGGADSSLPIVVYHYGIAGTKDGFNPINSCGFIVNKLGWHFVLVHRRGHDTERDSLLTIPKMSLFGDIEDNHACMLHICRRFPKSPIFLFGNSAGTAVIVRYLGDLGLKRRVKSIGNFLKKRCDSSGLDAMGSLDQLDAKSVNIDDVGHGMDLHGMQKLQRYYAKLRRLHDNLGLGDKYAGFEAVHARISAFVCVCPGYDISCCFERMPWLSKQMLFGVIKEHFVKQKNNVGFRSFTDLRERKFNSLSQFLRIFATDITGYDTYEHYLLENNPMVSAKYVLKHGLIINSMDDPICKSTNVDDWRHLVETDTEVVHVQTKGELELDVQGKELVEGTESWVREMTASLPNAVLMETDFGSHCCYFDAFGGVWTNHVVADYFRQVYKMRQAK